MKQKCPNRHTCTGAVRGQKKRAGVGGKTNLIKSILGGGSIHQEEEGGGKAKTVDGLARYISGKGEVGKARKKRGRLSFFTTVRNNTILLDSSS